MMLFVSSVGAVAASGIVSLAGAVSDPLRVLMPQRWLNLSIVCFIPILIGTLGWEFYVTGEHSLALSTSQRALKLNKRLSFVHANIGLLYTLKRDLDKAIASYRQCLDLDKNEIENVAIQDLIDLQKRSKET